MDIVAGNAFSAPLVTNALTGAQMQTLTNGDTLTGQGTTPILTAMLEGTTATTTITSTGVETFSLQNLAGAGETIDGTITGLKNVAITQATGLTTIAGLQSKLETLSLASANGNGFTGTFAASALSGSADAATITLDTQAGGAVTLGGSGTNGYETFNVKSVNGSSRLSNLTEGGTNTSLANLVLTGSYGLTFNNTAVGTTNSAPIDASITKIDASQMAAATTGGTVAGVTIGGQKTNGTVDTADNAFNFFDPSATAAGSVVITGGAGADSFFINAADSTNKLNITGGDGTDRVTLVGSGALNTTTTVPTIAGVEELRFTEFTTIGGDSAFGLLANTTLNLNGVTGVNKLVMDGSGNAGGSNNTRTLTLANMTQASALTVEMNGDGAALTPQLFNGLTYTPVLGGNTTVAMNIGNQGTTVAGERVGALSLGATTALTVTGKDTTATTGTLTFDSVTANSLTTVTVTTPGDFIVTAGNFGSNTVLNADFSGVGRATTANVSQAAGGNVKVGATAGANNITLTGTGVGATLDGSLGTGTQALTGSTVVDTIIGGSGNDTITGRNGIDSFTTNDGIDTIVYAGGVGSIETNVAGASANTLTTWAATTSFGAISAGDTLAGAEIVTDLAAGDRITLGNTSVTAAAGTVGAITNNTYTIVKGTYAGTTFTAGAGLTTGADALLMWDADSAATFANQAMIIQGGGTLTATIGAGTLTFA